MNDIDVEMEIDCESVLEKVKMEGESGGVETVDQISNGLTPELYFLISNALSVGPLAHVGDMLTKEASERGLFPSRTDFLGQRHQLTLSELQRKYRHIGPDGLALAARILLETVQKYNSDKNSWKKPSSILDPAVVCDSTRIKDREQLIDVSLLLWSLWPLGARNEGEGLSVPRLSLLKECGVVPLTSVDPSGPFPSKRIFGKMEHHWTVRGHSQATYCVAVDPTGRFIFTGSDDRLVKIWSATTAMLVCTCRGHELEISDLAVAPDSSCFASCSTDSNIRIWNLAPPKKSRHSIHRYGAKNLDNGDENVEDDSQKPIGFPLAVLRGHTNVVTFIDFSPTHPHILVSSGFDGVCRIWNVACPSSEPIVLRPIEGVRSQVFGTTYDFHLTRRAERRRTGLRGTDDNTARIDYADLNRGITVSNTRGAIDSTEDDSGRRRRTGRQTNVNRQGLTDNTDVEDEGDALEGNQEEQAHAIVTCIFSQDGQYIIAGSADSNAYVWRIRIPNFQREDMPCMTNFPSSQIEGSVDIEKKDNAPKKNETVFNSNKPICYNIPPIYSVWEDFRTKNLEDEVSVKDDAVSEHIVTAITKKRGQQTGVDESQPWPPIVEEMVRLPDHESDVYLIQQSHNGRIMATGSKDGNICLWKCPRHLRRPGRRPGWTLKATLTCPIDEEALALARHRRRALPSPRVDQMAFTADDVYLVASFQDCAVHVFDVASGEHLHKLSCIHTEQIHVLLSHPYDTSIAISAGYGGEVVVWDVAKGYAIKSFDSRKTRPDGRTWPEEDRLPFTDGFISPNGEYFVLTDAGGQLHTFGLGQRPQLTERAPYDQFLSTDYEPLIWDSAGNAASAETQLPAHILTGREALCDISLDPYPLPFQSAFKEKRLLRASKSEASWLQPGKYPGYLLASPTLTIAAWRAYSAGGSDVSVQNAIARANRRLEEHEQRLDRLAGADGFNRSFGTIHAANEASNITRQNNEETVNLVDVEEDTIRNETLRGTASNQGVRTRLQNAIDEYVSERELEELLGEEAIDGRMSRRSARLSRIDAIAADESHPSGVSGDELREMQRRQREERARRRQEAHEASLQSRRRSRQQRATARMSNYGNGVSNEERSIDPETEEYYERYNVGNDQRIEPTEDDEFVPSNSPDDESLFSHDEEGNVSTLDHSFDAYLEEEEEDEEELLAQMQNDLTDDETFRAASRPRGRPHGSRDRPRSGRRGRPRGRTRGRFRNRDRNTNRRRRREASQLSEGSRPEKRRRRARLNLEDAEEGASVSDVAENPRPFSAYGWLVSPINPIAEYVPQKGDEVVYLRQGHSAAIMDTDEHLIPPWQSLLRGRALRPVEPCLVEEISYIIASDGSDITIPRLILKLNDPQSPLNGQKFTVDIPAPSMGQAEFVILRSRFEATARHRWSLGDTCYAYWQTGALNEDGTSGAEWWKGVIEGDKCLEPPNNLTKEQILTDVYNCQCLWERFKIRWIGTVKISENPESIDEEELLETANEVDISLHSPWELFIKPNNPPENSINFKTEIRDESSSYDGALNSENRMSNHLIDTMGKSIEIAAGKDDWMLFQAAPEWDDEYHSVQNVCEFYNRRVALPIGLSDVAARLHMKYYRQPDALLHDLKTIAINAAIFNGQDSAIATEARNMVRYLEGALHSALSGSQMQNIPNHGAGSDPISNNQTCLHDLQEDQIHNGSGSNDRGRRGGSKKDQSHHHNTDEMLCESPAGAEGNEHLSDFYYQEDSRYGQSDDSEEGHEPEEGNRSGVRRNTRTSRRSTHRPDYRSLLGGRGSATDNEAGPSSRIERLPYNHDEVLDDNAPRRRNRIKLRVHS